MTASNWHVRMPVGAIADLEERGGEAFLHEHCGSHLRRLHWSQEESEALPYDASDWGSGAEYGRVCFGRWSLASRDTMRERATAARVPVALYVVSAAAWEAMQ